MNVFTNEVTKELIWRNFFHTVWGNLPSCPNSLEVDQSLCSGGKFPKLWCQILFHKIRESNVFDKLNYLLKILVSCFHEIFFRWENEFFHYPPMKYTRSRKQSLTTFSDLPLDFS